MTQGDPNQTDKPQTDGNRLTSAPSDPPRRGYHSGEFPQQEQEQPGLTKPLDPQPDHGEKSYVGTAPAGGEDRVDHRR